MNQKGFSLMEILVSLIFLALGFLAIAEMQMISIKQTHSASHLTRATILCQNKLEELQNAVFYDPLLTSGHPPQKTTVSGTVYTVHYNVTRLGNTTKEITATVQWSDGGVHSITLRTIKSR